MRSRPPPPMTGRVERATIARRAASSSRSRRSASGVRAGANKRPLNGVTRRSPARQPAWASRPIARRASHKPTAPRGCSAAVAERLDAVALAIHRMPQRHEPARFREQQEEQAIHDRERLLEGSVDIGCDARATSNHQGLQHVSGCSQHAFPQRPAHARCVSFRSVDELIERSAGAPLEHFRARETPERRKRSLIVCGKVQVELGEPFRVEPSGVDEPQVHAVEQKQPGRRVSKSGWRLLDATADPDSPPTWSRRVRLACRGIERGPKGRGRMARSNTARRRQAARRGVPRRFRAWRGRLKLARDLPYVGASR